MNNESHGDEDRIDGVYLDDEDDRYDERKQRELDSRCLFSLATGLARVDVERLYNPDTGIYKDGFKTEKQAD